MCLSTTFVTYRWSGRVLDSVWPGPWGRRDGGPRDYTCPCGGPPLSPRAHLRTTALYTPNNDTFLKSLSIGNPHLQTLRHKLSFSPSRLNWGMGTNRQWNTCWSSPTCQNPIPMKTWARDYKRKHKLNSKQIADSAFCPHLRFGKIWRL